MSSTEIARTDLSPAFDTPVSDSTAQVSTIATEPAPPAWSLPTRIGFRFFAAYFFLYSFFDLSLFARLFSLLPFRVVSPGGWSSVQTFNTWVAADVLKWPQPFSRNQGAGDKPIDYAMVIGLLGVAVLITLIWSAVDWKRKSYPRLLPWFRVMLRLSIATSLVSYGWMKFFPLQMPSPNLTRLLEPYGHFSLMAVLWAKIGSSTAYEIFTGAAELLVSALLLIPGMATVGALIAIPVTFQVWMLNMTYDVPVKLFSFHLLAMSTVLLMPDLRRLLTFFVMKRPADPPREGRLFRNLIAHRVVLGLQVAFGVWVMWSSYQTFSASAAQRSNQPKPPLYGIWNIEKMWIDGVERAPLLTDHGRWRRMVIQTAGSVSFQRMDDTFSPQPGRVEPDGKTMVFTVLADPRAAAAGPVPPNAPRKEVGRYAIEQPAPDRLIMEGALHGTKYRMEMKYFDPANFRLMKARFNLMADRPWNISNADYVPDLYR